ncbi:oxidoreductase, partial [Dickeya fangzhongdai]|nr:oxidoreductase [Dickeya fangzhongdai]
MMQQVFFPATVLRGAGVSQQLGGICARLGSRVLVAGGHQALAAAQTLIIEQLRQSGVTLTAVEWSGEQCSVSQIERLCAR